MNILETRKLNQFLKTLSTQKNSSFSIYVDNLHTAYILTPQNYILPSFHKFHFEYEPCYKYLTAIAQFIPEAIEGCQVLSYPKPLKEVGKLCLIKEISYNGFPYLYLFKLDLHYLGGSLSQAYIKRETSYHTSSVTTNKIYFSSRIVPITDIIQEGNTIIDFKAKEYTPGLFMVEKDANTSKIRHSAEIFDDIDYSKILDPIYQQLEIDKFWQPSKVYRPLYIEYQTLSLRFFEPSFQMSLNEFQSFSGFLEFVHTENLDIFQRDVENYHKWLSSHSVTRTQSLSGNMLWEIKKNV